MNSVSILFILGSFCWNVRKYGGEEQEISLDKRGQKVKDLKLRRKVTGNLILLRGKERACID